MIEGFRVMTPVQWLDQQAWFHAIVRFLRIRALASWLLRLRPPVRFFSSGTKVEISGLESFYLCDEIFQRETYKDALSLAGNVKTVCDLGCNTGYFCCYLRHYFGRTDFLGIGIDANPAVLKSAQRNLDLNNLSGISLLNGLVGGAGKPSEKFYVYPSNLGSSQFTQVETGTVRKGDWKEIEVPVLHASEIWSARYGNEPIDLLKIDIEGSEGNLLTDDPALFQKSSSLVIEWHKWLVKEEKFFSVLHELGFLHRQRLEQEETHELWFFSRRVPHSPGPA